MIQLAKGYFMIREIREHELDELFNLYLHLHESGIPEMTEHLARTWDTILRDEHHHIIVCEIDGKLVVTLNIPPKPLWENDGSFVVVTLGDVTKYYYGRTTINTQTDYYFKFEIRKKELV